MLSSLLNSMLSTITGFTSSVVDMASHFEQTQKGLETVLQSAEKGAELFEDLRKFSFETTFGVDELASASTQLLNAGAGVKDLNKQLKMLGDVAQGDKNKFAELSAIYSKILLQGKASSMQLSQFNFRGVPLAKTLKEMGVEGTASFEQVREALEKLTDEGGQFHNAMDNIIDTIEGKRGFIADTQKEILVNLGEATGLTDSYKAMLDLVYSVLENVNNALMAINENPALKALVTGLFTTAMTSLAIAIGASLLPKLKLVLRTLIKINALKGPLGWITLAVGGIATAVSFVTSELNSVSWSEKILKDETAKANAELAEQIKKLKELKGYERAKASTEYESGKLGFIEKEIEKYQQKISDLKVSISGLESLSKRGRTISGGVNYNTQIEGLKKEITLYSEKIKMLEDEKRIQREVLANTEKYESNWKLINSYTGNDNNSRLKELKESLSELNKMYSAHAFEKAEIFKGGKRVTVMKDLGLQIELDPDLKPKLDDAVKYLKNEIKEIEVKLKLANLNDWQKVIKDAFNFSDTDILNLGGEGITGAKAVAEYTDRVKNNLSHMITFADALGLDKMDLIKSAIGDVENAIKTLAESNLWEANEGTIEKLKNLLWQLRTMQSFGQKGKRTSYIK